MKIGNSSFAQDLKKLGASTLLDLAITTPVLIENNFLTKTPTVGEEVVVEVECKDSFKRAKTLNVNSFSELWGRNIVLVFFHPKPFHYAKFKSKEKLFVKGKLQRFHTSLQIVQPKIITKINTIIPKYKTPLKDATIQSLISKFLNFEGLKKEGLKDEEIETLLKLHSLNIENIYMYNEPYFSKNITPLLKFVEAFNYLRKLSKKKRVFKALKKIEACPEEFIKNLPFKLTKDQNSAILDIAKDLNSSNAAKRVVMGDVGSGKTIVILATMAMAFPNRSILMAPTTILAMQLFEEAKKFLDKKINISLVTSNLKAKDLENSHVIIGTHALLYENLPTCEVVMIDEQHRFGTNQRDLLHKLATKQERHPHFFQFTATPIPRTLSMMHESLVDYSFMKETPFVKNIDTKVVKKSEFSLLLKHIENEIEKDHQIAIIYPLTKESDSNIYQSLEEGRGFWEKRFKNVFVTHGKDKEKEEILEKFAKKGSILLATTVIEVGISLPKLSTIIIVGAERLGLASLHQLRGRVSRTGIKGYCFLFTYKDDTKRLNDFTKSNNGFEIAELDLKYRQSGSMLDGIFQHGSSFKWFKEDDLDILKEAKKRVEALKPPKV